MYSAVCSQVQVYIFQTMSAWYGHRQSLLSLNLVSSTEPVLAYFFTRTKVRCALVLFSRSQLLRDRMFRESHLFCLHLGCLVRCGAQRFSTSILLLAGLPKLTAHQLPG
jgi:hypothetical protein